MGAVAAFVAFLFSEFSKEFKHELKFKNLLSIELFCGLEKIHFDKVCQFLVTIHFRPLIIKTVMQLGLPCLYFSRSLELPEETKLSLKPTPNLQIQSKLWRPVYLNRKSSNNLNLINIKDLRNG